MKKNSTHTPETGIQEGPGCSCSVDELSWSISGKNITPEMLKVAAEYSMEDGKVATFTAGSKKQAACLMKGILDGLLRTNERLRVSKNDDGIMEIYTVTEKLAATLEVRESA